MSLLIDYSKRRAEIGPRNEESFSWNSDTTGDLLMQEEDEDDASFACCGYGEVVENNKDHTSFTKLIDESLRTISTAENSSSESITSYDEISAAAISEAPISFRIKRSSMGGSVASGIDTQQSADDNKIRVSRSERLHFSLQDIKSKQGDELPTLKKKFNKPAPYRRTATAPARVNSGDSLHGRLQYAAWKKRQQSLLSASAEIATSSDRDLYQKPGRRGSMPHLTSGPKEEDLLLVGLATSDHREVKKTNSSLSHKRNVSDHSISPSRHSSSRRRRVTMSHVNHASEVHVTCRDGNSSRSTRSATTTRRVTMSHVNHPPEGQVTRRGGGGDHSFRSTRRVTMSHVNRGDHSSNNSSKSTRRVTMTHVNHPAEETAVPVPPSFERRRTSEMDALQALRAGGSFYSTSSRGQDAAPKQPPSCRYSRRKRLAHNDPPPALTALKAAVAATAHAPAPALAPAPAPALAREPRRISELDSLQAIRTNSMHSQMSNSSSRSRSGRPSSSSSSSKKTMMKDLSSRSSTNNRMSNSFHAGYSSRRSSSNILAQQPAAATAASFRRQGTFPPTALEDRRNKKAAPPTRRTSNSSSRRRRSFMANSRSPSGRKALLEDGSNNNNARQSSRRSSPSGRRVLFERNLLQPSLSFHGVPRRASNQTATTTMMSGSSSRGTTSQRRLQYQQQQHNESISPRPRRMSVTTTTTTATGTHHHRKTASDNNLNDFVTGSRIRRLELDSELGLYHDWTSFHLPRTSFPATTK